ncbi:toll-like receptor 2 [Babylonia areolata]|uniref:toll-like receptor 2 n=1 Tax=Babylonia areolata TaxID=304850 RepID=UPI003FD0187F
MAQIHVCHDGRVFLFAAFLVHALATFGVLGSGVSTATETDPPPGVPCGEGLCLCTRLSANCSGRLAQVMHIPSLPDNIVYLDLSHNNFSSNILTRNIFENLTNIYTLHLSSNKFTWLPRYIFEKMKNLNFLNLNNNKELQIESLREVLSIQSLRKVEAKNCNLSPPPVGLFQNMTTLVSHLDLSSNPYGGSYHLDGFCNFNYLEHVKLSDCDFQDITSSCPILFTDLDLTGNTLRAFPKTCVGGESMFPLLTFLRLSHNRIHTLSSSDICLPWLTDLYLSYNHIKVFPTGAFSYKNFPALQTLYLQHQYSFSGTASGRTRIEDNAFQNPHLQYLDLSYNQLDFNDLNNVGEHPFADCYGMTDLILISNNFMNVDDQRFNGLFRHLQSLVYLSLQYTGLGSFSNETFSRLRRLRGLYIQDNIISNIPDGAFDSLQSLTLLYLHNNRIKSITQNTFGEGLRGRLKTLTLGLNPLECSCELLWFQDWFKSDLELFTGLEEKITDYKCSNVPEMTLADFSMAEQACVLSRETSLLLIQINVLVVVSLTMVSLIFRYRWHFRLLLYELFRGRDNLRRQRLQADNFHFDVFVSYASEDLPWVRQQLMGRLEAELGLRLCVHERDFLPGRHIVDNIAHSVDSSRKVLMVFSANFLRSQWCQFELSVCLTHVMDVDDSLIVVCVDDVMSRDMTSAMKAVLKTTTYIQWSEDEGEEAVASFWRRLHLALREILPRGQNHV